MLLNERISVMSRANMRITTAALVGLGMLIGTSAHAASDPTGVWINDTGRGAIEIKPCGNALCGHVVWVKDEADAAKGCGKKIIGEAKSSGGGRWDNGWIYSPERKKTYDVELKPLANGTLQVTGYAGTKLFSRTMIWTKAGDDLKRCDAPTIEAKAPDASADTPTVESTKPAVTPADPKASEPAIAAESKKPVDQPTEPDKSDDKVASVESTPEGDDEGPPTAREKAPNIGGVDLDKVFTRTKSGKCKLDLPWVKVQFECEKE
jgi:uncharacterized protein (DUF2147 family)